MSVWVTIPSARPAAEVREWVKTWHYHGYQVALMRDDGVTDLGADLVFSVSPYPGYAVAVNALIGEVMVQDQFSEFFVIGGDDTYPDPHKTASRIAGETRTASLINVLNNQTLFNRLEGPAQAQTLTVMQPTGDRFASGAIDRICGSAWIGREFALRAYRGAGPLWPEYRHMFVDEELQEVAMRLKVLQHRRDICQLHRHFMRETDELSSDAVKRPIPPHLVVWNSPEHWNASKAIFDRRKSTGFAGCEFA